MAVTTGLVLAGAAVANSAYQGKKNRDAIGDANNSTRYLRDAQADTIDRAKAIADRPYEAYEGDRFAELSQNETMGIDRARQNATNGEARGYLDKAGQQIDQVAGSQWNNDTAQKYMNPYMQQVVDNSIRDETTAFSKQQNEIGANASRAGAFGGGRQAILESENTGQHLKAVGDISATGRANAYQSAIQTWQADNQRKLGAATAYRQAGGDISNMNSAQVKDLIMTGGVDRVLRQQGADFNYQQFVENRDWDVNNLTPLLRATGQAQNLKDTPMPADQTAGNLLGLASTLVGYFGQQGGGSGYEVSSTPETITGMAAGGDMNITRPTIG